MVLLKPHRGFRHLVTSGAEGEASQRVATWAETEILRTSDILAT
jgi:hypothetical protein